MPPSSSNTPSLTSRLGKRFSNWTHKSRSATTSSYAESSTLSASTNSPDVSQSRSGATTPIPTTDTPPSDPHITETHLSKSPQIESHVPGVQAAALANTASGGPSAHTPDRPEAPLRLDSLIEMVNKATHVKPEDIALDDIIIAVMGPTGTGKTTFIQAVAGPSEVGLDVGHSLSAGTTGVSCVKVNIDNARSSLILVDTPGFDDPDKTDAQILEIIAEWLEKTYRRKILLTGLVYLHRITDIRHDVGIQNTMNVFQRLAGPNAFERVALVTTMWNDLRDKQIGVEREEQLMNNHWRPMIIRKAMTGRFDSSNRDTAVKVIRDIVERNTKTVLLQLQEELVDRKKSLPSTSAGKLAFTLEEAMKWRLRQLAGTLTQR